MGQEYEDVKIVKIRTTFTPYTLFDLAVSKNPKSTLNDATASDCMHSIMNQFLKFKSLTKPRTVYLGDHPTIIGTINGSVICFQDIVTLDVLHVAA